MEKCICINNFAQRDLRFEKGKEYSCGFDNEDGDEFSYYVSIPEFKKSRLDGKWYNSGSSSLYFSKEEFDKYFEDYKRYERRMKLERLGVVFNSNG